MRGHYANIAERAVGLTATVRVRGPDPRGDVAADAAFFTHHRPDDDLLPGADGAPVVAISATALRIPTRASTRQDGRPAAGDDRKRFIAPLAPFLPFLAARDDARDDRPRARAPLASPLAPGVEVHVRLGREGLGGDEPGGWTRARVLASCVPRDASNAVDALAGPAGLGALRRGWTAGGVAPLGDASHVPLGAAVTGVVLIETNARASTPPPPPPPQPPPPPPEWRDAFFVREGAPIVACGSPFAALSPTHFACAVFGGHVSRAWGRREGRRRREGGDSSPGDSSPGESPGNDPPLLLADVVALPGTEGAPVLDADGGGVIGVLTPPLVRLERGRDGVTRATEMVPLVLTMASIRDALRELVSGSSFSAGDESPGGESPGESPVGPASSSSFRNASNPLDAVVRGSVVVLETDGGASWASGVVIGVHGGGGEGEEGGGGIGGVGGVGEVGGGRPRRALVLTNAHVVHPSSTAAGGDGKGPMVRSIRVGIPGTNSWLNDAAPVYVSRGPLDVAVVELKLHSPNDARRLVPVKRRLPMGAGGSRLSGASPGSPVAVVGFGRVGPGAIDAGFIDCSPAVHLGSVSAVVNFSHPSPAYSRSRDRIPSSSVPAVYQTTASVHSGASGGAVVCPQDGTLLGLVTSNARLGAGGRVIPNLNFSIPVELLDRVLATAAAKGVGDWARAFEGCLEEVETSDELRSIWSLRDPASTGGEGLTSKL